MALNIKDMGIWLTNTVPWLLGLLGIICWLVLWNILYFSNIWDVILPIDFHIFQRGRLNHQPAYYYPSLIIIITILTIINSILPTNGRYTTNQFLSSSHLWRLRIGAPGQESWLPVETPQAGLLQAAQRTMAA